ncbi:glycosyltransferase [Algibacter sp. 2305UL17-15]|uniref:glycosyltransferase n=1 Tax=Algibacter sp. 2305UL17-15 TaxID=3231268 RepID=UPI00345A39C0
MKLSIIIPVYNVEKYISRCLDSILIQGLDINDFEILLINDGSTDNSVSVIDQYKLKYNNIKIHNQKNGGAGKARNKGISLASGEYIYFIDPDDYLANNVLKNILSYVYSLNLDVLTFNTIVTDNPDLDETSVNVEDIKPSEVYSGKDYIDYYGFRNEVWWYVAKSKYVKDIGAKLVEGRFLEDAIYTISIILNSNRIAHWPVAAHRYVKVSNSAMTSNEPNHYLKVIYDMQNVAESYYDFIRDVENKGSISRDGVQRLKSRQQSFVFFMMVRMLKSTIKLKDVKSILNSLENVGAYPLNSFIGKDYSKKTYFILSKIFNSKPLYYLIFGVFNPILKRL